MPQLVAIEDNNRGLIFSVSGRNQSHGTGLQYHRRWAQTITEMRNLQ